MKKNGIIAVVTILLILICASCAGTDRRTVSSAVSKSESSSSETSSEASSAVSSSSAASSAVSSQAPSSAPAQTTTPQTTTTQTQQPAQAAAPSWPSSGAVPSPFYVPNLDGQNVFQNDAAAIDLSYTSYGFVKIHLKQTSAARCKVWIHNTGDYYYDLKTDCSTEIYPLQMGGGSYSISVLQNTSGNNYAYLATTTVNVNFVRSDAPYLVPSQIVNYNSGSQAVSIAQQLVSGKSNNYERISAVLSYVASHIHYNYSLASSVQSGYIPDIEADISNGSGICYDYSAVAAAMLRSLGYPTKLIMGYAGSTYHAWNEVYISGQGWVKVMSVTVNTSEWSRVDVTFISTATSPDTIAQYIANSGNYKTTYVY